MGLIVVGLMSGTSVDGIDAALVEIQGSGFNLQVKFLAGATYSYPPSLREQILDVCAGAALSAEAFARLDDDIAHAFAQAAIAIQQGQPAAQLIGSHGQTIFHRPPQDAHLGYSWQMGRGAVIAAQTGLATVSNFRAADIAAGGQGAPLVPKIDAYLLADAQKSRCIQNIGGIGNFTYLPAYDSFGDPAEWEDKIRGWDTGPGNVLMDLAVQRLSNGAQTYDANGAWAAQGEPCQPLVEEWLKDPFLHQPPPKSTGRERFGVDYFHQCWQSSQAFQLSPADLLATLTEFTARSIVQNYQLFLEQMPDQVYLCGGGSHNHYLQQRLQVHLSEIPVFSTVDIGLNSDFKEAIAFAVLAYWQQQGISGNLPQVTGAKTATLLGEITGNATSVI